MKRLTALCAALVITFAAVAAVELFAAPPASAASCKTLARKMFTSSNPVYWAKRYYGAGCGG